MKISEKLMFAGSLLIAPVMFATSSARTWSVIETARDNSHRLSPIAAPVVSSGGASSVALTLDPAQQFQEMSGFGGALTESSAWVLAQLPAEKRAEVLHRYFDPQEGLGYTLARTHLNSCDFSLNMWALDETPGDYDLLNFSLAPMRRWLMPLLHDANNAAKGKLNLLVSPWSPPAWMKTNNRMDAGGSLRSEYAPAWAQYYVKFVQAMEREEKLSIWALTVQNEPQANQVWESCLYSPEQERDFVRDHLGPALEKAGLQKVKLLGFDHNRDILEKQVAALFGDPASSKYLWGAALHWYVSNDFAASSRVHAAYPDKHILFTEGCWEGGGGIGLWQHGEGYAHQMIGDFNHWVCGFIDWNIVLDQRGGPNHVGNFCDAPVIIDTHTGEVRYQSAFYYIGQFSKFVKPGAHRIASTGGPAALQSVAFMNPDSSLVTVVLNETDLAITFNLAVDAESLACTIPAHAIQSYVGAAR